MKTMKRNLSIILALCIMVCSVMSFTVNAGATNEERNDVSHEENELQPIEARYCSEDQYANQYFSTLDQAKMYYGYDYTYVRLKNPIHKDAGTYGGYYSNGGTYTYYYPFSNGSRCYIHVGVNEGE